MKTGMREMRMGVTTACMLGERGSVMAGTRWNLRAE